MFIFHNYIDTYLLHINPRIYEYNMFLDYSYLANKISLK